MKRSNKIHNADLFTDAANENYRKHIRTQSKQALEKIDELIDWERLIKPLAQRIDEDKKRKSEAGRKPHDLLVIVKCLLLQMMYGLSDPRLEEELADRRSFQIFVGLVSGDSIPDETTICRYRELFARLKLDKELFKSFNRQLEERGFILGEGTIVDATLKEAQAKPSSGRDKDASFTRRGGKVLYGYKGHVGVDVDTNVIHSVEFTPAHVHDTHKFEELLLMSEKMAYGDKGYAGRRRKVWLGEVGIGCGILAKAYRNRPLSKACCKRNKMLSRIRNRVEKPFSFFKEVLQYRRCRYFDLNRNRFQFVLCSIVYNIRRLLTLSMAKVC